MVKEKQGFWNLALGRGAINNIYIYIQIYIYIYIIHIYIYIYRATPGLCPGVAALEVSHSQTNADAISQNSNGKNNKGTREY